MIEVDDGPGQGVQGNGWFYVDVSFWRAWCSMWKVRDWENCGFWMGQLLGQNAEGRAGVEGDY